MKFYIGVALMTVMYVVCLVLFVFLAGHVRY